MIKVVSSPHTAFASKILVSQLIKLGHNATLCTSIDKLDKSTYIIYNSFTIKHLPENYIVMQTEVADSKWFTKHYRNVIKNAKAVWEYSSDNIPCYEKYNDRIAIVSPGVHKQPVLRKDIDYLFYGWIEGSDRRIRIISELQRMIPMTVVTNKLSYSMWSTLIRTKVVINIHYYDRSPFELYRINEALSFNCQVVSEPPEVKRYTGLVKFSDSIEMIARAAITAKNYPQQPNLNELCNISEIDRAIKLYGI